MVSTVETRRARYRPNDESLGASTPGESQSEGIRAGSENSLAMTLLWFFVWLIANLIGDEEGLTFDPVNFWAGWLLLALALDLAGAHAKRASKAGR